MSEMLFNLAVFVTSGCVAAGLANLIWQKLTHQPRRRQPAA